MKKFKDFKNILSYDESPNPYRPVPVLLTPIDFVKLK